MRCLNKWTRERIKIAREPHKEIPSQIVCHTPLESDAFKLDAGDVSIVSDVLKEYNTAKSMYPAHQTLEHSMCVLEEEVAELLAEIRKKPDLRSVTRIREEAVQVAAMAIRMLSDSTSTTRAAFDEAFETHVSAKKSKES